MQVDHSEKALTLEHLVTLPKRNKDHFISTFTKEQQLHSQQYLYEGQRVAQSWDNLKSPIINSPASPKNDPQLGFETPVLRARLDTRTGCLNGPINTGRDQTIGGQESSKENERPSGHSANLLDAAKQGIKLKAERQKNVSRADKKRSKEHHLRSDSDNESVKRRADRRQRKKTKRNIMNPPDAPGDSDNEDGPLTTCKNRKQTKRQSKLRQEFALMHGFPSTNVGKNRLTLKPGHRDIGVFQKGKASRKTDVMQAGKHKRQESGFLFSEATFLDKPRQKVSRPDIEKVAKILTTKEEDSMVASSSSSSTLPSTDARTDSAKAKAKVRSRKFKDSQVPSRSNLVSKTKLQNREKVQTSYNPADSIVWDIEQSALLGSEVSSGVKQGTIILKLPHLPLMSNKVLGNDMLDANISTMEAHVKSSHQKSLYVTQSDALSSPSLGPSQSASQIGLRTVNAVSLPTVSKYFKSLTPKSAEPHVALTINQLDTNPSAVSELEGLLTVENTVAQMPGPASHLACSPCPSAWSYCAGQEGRLSLIAPMQPNYDLEVPVYDEDYPDSELWPAADHPGEWSAELLDDIDDIADHASVTFDGEPNSNFVIPADDEIWTLDYTACTELAEMDQIYDVSLIPLSEHQSTGLQNSIPPSMWLSDADSDASERRQGVVYQESERDRLLSIYLGSEDQQMQPDGDFNLEHDGVSSMNSEPLPDVVHHFWQGRSLLYGLSTLGDSSLHKLSNVEADVARQLQLDHWQPQKF